MYLTELNDWKEQGEEPMSRAQQKLLNAACGDLAEQMNWHGYTMDKNGWRHMFSAFVLNAPVLPGWDFGDGRQRVIMLPRSSTELTKSQASDAITMMFLLGDYPDEQGIDSPPVRWCEVICLCRWIQADPC
jgi:hypothetical protein